MTNSPFSHSELRDMVADRERLKWLDKYGLSFFYVDAMGDEVHVYEQPSMDRKFRKMIDREMDAMEADTRRDEPEVG